jgi:hypothetical protein
METFPSVFQSFPIRFQIVQLGRRPVMEYFIRLTI